MNIKLKIDNRITDLNVTVSSRETVTINIEVLENDTTNIETLWSFDYEFDEGEGVDENLYDLVIQSDDISAKADINDFPFE